MDPISLGLIAAISAGAATGVSNATTQMVSDSYQGLKGLIKRKFGASNKAVEAIEKLEENPESTGWRESVETELTKIDATSDADLLFAAETLLEHIKALPSGEDHIKVVGNYNAVAQNRSTAKVHIEHRDNPSEIKK